MEAGDSCATMLSIHQNKWRVIFTGTVLNVGNSNSCTNCASVWIYQCLPSFFNGGTTEIIFGIARKLLPVKKFTAGRTVQLLLNCLKNINF
jgi:hypothetical protein